MTESSQGSLYLGCHLQCVSRSLFSGWDVPLWVGLAQGAHGQQGRAEGSWEWPLCSADGAGAGGQGVTWGPGPGEVEEPHGVGRDRQGWRCQDVPWQGCDIVWGSLEWISPQTWALFPSGGRGCFGVLPHTHRYLQIYKALPKATMDTCVQKINSSIN